jgi:hypothetical protein
MIKKAQRAAGVAIDLEDSIETAQAVYTELAVYLTSPKFHDDPTVQVADVLRRIQSLQESLLDAASEVREIRELLATKAAPVEPSLAEAAYTGGFKD